ncbi:DUF6525 family protein [Pseudooceanicola algae]
MQAFDALPSPVRSWLSEAALPWSPASCRKILRQARARGESLNDVLARLDRAQTKALARDRHAPPQVAAAPDHDEIPRPQGVAPALRSAPKSSSYGNERESP